MGISTLSHSNCNPKAVDEEVAQTAQKVESKEAEKSKEEGVYIDILQYFLLGTMNSFMKIEKILKILDSKQ